MVGECAILLAAEKVSSVFKRNGYDLLVIGGVALAAHNYIRFTEDLDFALNAPIATLAYLTKELENNGFCVELHEPDCGDPLGGVIDISGDFGLIQIVNFGERFPAIIEDALNSERIKLKEVSDLLVAPLEHLVALKLYAGGRKSHADIVELLERNPDANLDRIRKMCVKYKLRGIEPLIEEAGIGTKM